MKLLNILSLFSSCFRPHADPEEETAKITPTALQPGVISTQLPTNTYKTNRADDKEDGLNLPGNAVDGVVAAQLDENLSGNAVDGVVAAQEENTDIEAVAQPLENVPAPAGHLHLICNLSLPRFIRRLQIRRSIRHVRRKARARVEDGIRGIMPNYGGQRAGNINSYREWLFTPGSLTCQEVLDAIVKDIASYVNSGQGRIHFAEHPEAIHYTLSFSFISVGQQIYHQALYQVVYRNGAVVFE
ncbi:hypothetical protein HDV05_004058 [Chytridiales sp. JEL 0842]|nr:hypothetical protein HDV05_004058 [Chytridiales sp. JEL 0842]